MTSQDLENEILKLDKKKPSMDDNIPTKVLIGIKGSMDDNIPTKVLIGIKGSMDDNIPTKVLIGIKGKVMETN